MATPHKPIAGFNVPVNISTLKSPDVSINVLLPDSLKVASVRSKGVGDGITVLTMC